VSSPVITHDVAVDGLTDADYWDRFWATTRLPAEVRHVGHRSVDAILDVFDRHLDVAADGIVLEIGGAPGQYLAYVHRRLGCEVAILDLSPRGCRLASENMRMLGIEADIVCDDMFTTDSFLGRCDAVYSLGLVEHFPDLTAAVRGHMRFVRPGGTLIVGVPNFGGIYRQALSWLRPEMMRHNELSAMHAANWDRLEADLPLDCVWRGYVGGFDPLVAATSELSGRVPRLAAQTCRAAGYLLNRRPFGRLRRCNSERWSTYLMGVYRLRPSAEAT
jgi:SAM-dependent methyltransferase